MPRIAKLWNGNNEVRTNVLDAGMAFDLFKALLAPAGGERKKTQFTRLQRLVRVQKIGKKFFVGRKHVELGVKRPPDFLLQLFCLIRDFLLCGVNRILQCGIDNGYRFGPLLQSSFDFASILNEQSGNIFRDPGFADALTKFLRATPDVLNFETILSKEPLS